MTTVQTRFLGPTDRRGTRYKAVAGKGGKGFTLTLESEDRLNNEENHYRVARALIHKLGWFHDDKREDLYGDWFGGGTPTGYVFVCTVEYAYLDPEGPK